jgi:hypothetical protein
MLIDYLRAIVERKSEANIHLSQGVGRQIEPSVDVGFCRRLKATDRRHRKTAKRLGEFAYPLDAL